MTLEQHLLLLDMTVAYNLGAPPGHTLSSNAYRLSRQGHPFGVLSHVIIDAAFAALGDKNHCAKALDAANERNKNGSKR